MSRNSQIGKDKEDTTQWFEGFGVVAPAAAPKPENAMSALDELFDCCQTGDNYRVQQLIGSNKELVNCANAYGRTPLIIAAIHGHVKVVEMLLAAGADIEVKLWQDGYTPLIFAAFSGHEAVVRLLLEAGANKDATNAVGDTPLIRAAANGHEAVVRLLLASGADKDVTTKLGETAKDCAQAAKHKAVVELLAS